MGTTDPARPAPAFSIVPTDREPGTGYRYFHLFFISIASSKIKAGFNFTIFCMFVCPFVFFRAILEGLRENSVLTDVELNISNNEVSVAVQIWLRLE